MGGLIFTLLILFVILTALFWGGTVFLHSYWYTEASGAIYWQAPAAAGAVTFFYFLWCLLNVNAEGATPANVPYTTLFLFSNQTSRYPKPVERLVAIDRDGRAVRYRRYTVGQDQYQFFEESDASPKGAPYSESRRFVAIETNEDGKKVRYDLVKGEETRRFVSEDGWALREIAGGIDGNPSATSTGLLLMNWFLNLAHFGVWLACLWLILRFQLAHALGLAFVFWLVTTIFFLPLLMGQAGAVAQGSPRAAAAVSATPGCA